MEKVIIPESKIEQRFLASNKSLQHKPICFHNKLYFSHEVSKCIKLHLLTFYCLSKSHRY